MAMNRQAAFPQPIGDTSGLLHEPDPGMALRDWFAGKALAAIVPTAAQPCLSLSDEDAALVAHTSYQIADAMMRAREAR